MIVVLVLSLASISVWFGGLGVSELGLRRQHDLRRTALQGIAAAAVILVLVRVAILPLAARLTGQPLDLTSLGGAGDTEALARWLVHAWTLAAFGEEMVFRGYLISRIADLAGRSRAGWAAAVVIAAVAFGVAHAYQGTTGMISTGIIGCLLGLLYLYSGRNLWAVIICHATVDTVALLAIYFDQRSLVIP